MFQRHFQRFLARRDLLRMGLGTTAGIAGAAALNQAGVANTLYRRIEAGVHRPRMFPAAQEGHHTANGNGQKSTSSAHSLLLW